MTIKEKVIREAVNDKWEKDIKQVIGDMEGWIVCAQDSPISNGNFIGARKIIDDYTIVTGLITEGFPASGVIESIRNFFDYWMAGRADDDNFERKKIEMFLDKWE